jgi:hypothetical protein
MGSYKGCLGSMRLLVGAYADAGGAALTPKGVVITTIDKGGGNAYFWSCLGGWLGLALGACGSSSSPSDLIRLERR